VPHGLGLRRDRLLRSAALVNNHCDTVRDLFDVFDRSTVAVEWRGKRSKLRTGHGLFSADRLDEGTRLLLDHVELAPDARVLEIGCGYGALAIPIAAALPSTRLICVDRDVLAVRYAARNAAALGLENVETRASLGIDRVPERDFDLSLCNVPARIGSEGLAHLIEGGASVLSARGEMRIVAIRDLRPVLAEIAEARSIAIEEIAEGTRHSVFRISPVRRDPGRDPIVYARDEVECAGLRFARPHDASEDPDHAREGVPLLAELLPRAPSAALVWRSAHGVMAVLLARAGARVRAADRDLLALAFARENASRHGVAIESSEAAWLPELAHRTPLVVLELSSSAGIDAAACEIEGARAMAERFLALARSRLAAELVARDAGVRRLASRGGWDVLCSR
jgi:16S rRNA (guanine1207-N2)-methyltransferase